MVSRSEHLELRSIHRRIVKHRVCRRVGFVDDPDLAHAGVDLSQADDIEDLRALRDRTSRSLAEAAQIYTDRDSEAVHTPVQQMDEWTTEFDVRVDAQMDSDAVARDAVSRALLFRYLKRITAHTMNIISSLVMPLHRLDYYDEKKADRD